jgi:hypothetical protein
MVWSAAPGDRSEVRGHRQTGSLGVSSPNESRRKNDCEGLICATTEPYRTDATPIGLFFPETGRFFEKNREAIKHEPGNRREGSGAYIDFSKNK